MSSYIEVFSSKRVKIMIRLILNITKGRNICCSILTRIISNMNKIGLEVVETKGCNCLCSRYLPVAELLVKRSVCNNRSYGTYAFRSKAPRSKMLASLCSFLYLFQSLKLFARLPRIVPGFFMASINSFQERL